MLQRNARVFLLCLCLIGLFLLASCASAPAAEENAVTSVVPDGKGNITLDAVLTPGFLESYKGKTVHVFELPAERGGSADLTYLEPIAEVKAKGTVSVRFPDRDGVHTRLYSSFVLASYDASTRVYTPLTPAMAITDFSRVAEVGAQRPEAEGSIKGLVSPYPADAIRLGVSHTLVDVPMEQLILEGRRPGAVAYVWEGLSVYIDGEALDKLDKTVGQYVAAGVNVYLRFTLGAPTDSTPDVLYLTNPAGAEATRFMPNMTSGETVSILEGFFDFMADRYASPEEGVRPVTAFVVGHGVNDAAANGVTETTLAGYVSNYEVLVRLANTAIKTHNRDGRVYISLDSHRSSQHLQGGWDVPTFLSAFHDESILCGGYDWYPAVELYADGSVIWEENSTVDTEYYTVHSLRTLTDLLAGDKFIMSDGARRRLLVSGLSVPAVEVGGQPSYESALSQAASYAYAYMTCVQNGQIEAMIYSDYADAAMEAEDAALCGLWTVRRSGEKLLPAEKRALYGYVKKIDTTEAGALSEELTAVIGEPYTRLSQLLAGQASPVTAVTGEVTVGGYREDHGKASPLFTFDAGSMNGFADAGNLAYMELASAETLHTAYLYSRFVRTSPSDPMGITVTLSAAELMGGKELILDLYAGEPGDVGSAKPALTLRMTRHATGKAADGDGELIYEATAEGIRDGVWQSVEFDAKDFIDRLDRGDEVTVTLLLDCEFDGHLHSSCYLGLLGMHVKGSAVAAGGSSPIVVIAVVAVIAVAAVAIVVFLMGGKKKTYRPSR